MKKGVTEASRRYHISRQAIYNWKNRYDGTWKSLKEKSHRPHHHPNEHTGRKRTDITPLSTIQGRYDNAVG
ncbi:MAG: helix-turn-helix domain-containing protein [Oscillospiraceae bacterium]